MENFSQAFDSPTSGLLSTASAVQSSDTTKSHHRHHTNPNQVVVTESSTEIQQTSFTRSTATSTSTQSTSPTLRQISASSSTSSTPTKSSSSSTIATTSISSSSQTPSLTTTVPANPIGGPTNTSSASVAKHDNSSSVSAAGIAIRVILSLVVLCAIGFLIYRQRDRFLACIARHRKRKPKDEEEVRALKKHHASGDLVAETLHRHSRVRHESTIRESDTGLGASLDRPFSHPVMMNNSNDSTISPSNTPITGSGYSNEAVSPLSPSQYKPWAHPYTYKPYTYSRPSSTASPHTSKLHIGPPGRVLPMYARPKTKAGVWEVDAPSQRLLGNDVPR